MEKQPEKKVSYTENEKILLASVIRDKGALIESKKTDGATLQQKQKAWEAVTDFYNAQPEITCRRTSLQLKKLWSNLKQKKRKFNTDEAYEFLLTGGGVPEPKEVDPVLELIDVAAPHLDVTLECKWDSTEMYLASKSKDSLVALHTGQVNAKDVHSEGIIPHGSYVADPATSSPGPHASMQNTCSSLKPNPKKGFNEGSFDEEKQLRIQKLKEAIQQQHELHEVRMAAARAELEGAQATSKLAQLKLQLFKDP